MPQVIIPIALAVSAAIGAVGLGEEIANQPSTPNPAVQQKQQAQAAASNNAQQQAADKSAIAQQFPNLQEQLGGAVAPDYYQEASANLIGDAGDTNVAKGAWDNFQGDKSLTSTTGLGTNPGNNIWESIQRNGLPGFEGSSQQGLEASGGST
jgi:hypothetical protein